MKYLYLILGFVLLILLLILMVLNTELSVNISLIHNIELELYVWGIMLLSSIMAAFSMAFFTAYLLKVKELNVKKQTRKAEKASIQAEESSDKIKALENKIQTLETALQRALKAKK